jgi:formate dehydrogenase major subunit
MQEIKIKIDGQEYLAKTDETILEVAERNGIKIPTLCHHQELKPFTSCFICVVEAADGKMLPACSTKVAENMEVFSYSKRVQETRKVAIELILSEHCGDCLPPCQKACPASCDVKGYLGLIAQNKPLEALKLIKETIPMPASIGRVCPRPCQDDCRRNAVDQTEEICFLKRYAADADITEAKQYLPEKEADTGKKVAIIGAGPAGLSAAFFLLKKGHKVTLFEKQDKAGGMLRWGIPEYRLPKAILDKEIQTITDLGAEIKYNVDYSQDLSAQDLKNEYDATLIAIGAQGASSMRVEGEDLEGVIPGIEFLDDVAKGKEVNIGKKVVVVGGGNTAIDVARTSLRLGAEVTLLYRRTRNEMPANLMEIEAAEHEDINMAYLAAPVKILKEGAQLKIECIKMKLGEPDASGRRRPVPQEGSEYTIIADAVMSAIGQKVLPACIKDLGVELSKWDTVNADEKTFATNIQGVFSAGDCVIGPDIAIRAIAQGRKAAVAMDQMLKGEEIVGEKELYDASMGKWNTLPKEMFEEYEAKAANKMPELEAADRVDNFKEIELGFNKNVAEEEAARCLECGCKQVDDCILRELATEYGAQPERWKGEHKEYNLDKSHQELDFESNKCILCGTCTRYAHEVKKQDVVGFVNRGFDTVIKPVFGEPLGNVEFDFADKLAEICPTGAIARKNS